MKAKDSRKTIKALGKLCKRNGIEFVVDCDRGRGSHRALIFRDEKTGETVQLVFPGSHEISPGVQRNSLSYLNDLAIKVAEKAATRELAEAVRSILESYFG